MTRQDGKRRKATSNATTYLRGLGQRLRASRAQHGMTRQSLAKQSGVSQRFLAHLESGDGNPSIILLRQIAHAMGVPVTSLIEDAAPRPLEQKLIVQTLNRLSAPELVEVRRFISGRFARAHAARQNYVALIGLRGAGKSTLGTALASHMGVPFVVLDREVEKEYGGSIAQILDLRGHSGYLQYERDCLKKVLARHDQAVIEIGGGLATDAEALDLLLETTLTVWLRATPQEHMQRVIKQGDLRPIAQSKVAMIDLRSILKARQLFYRKAALQLNTSRKTPAQSLKALIHLIESVQA